jgi:hypothetical protein
MNETFVDRPGDLTSDGKHIKFTLQSVKKQSDGRYALEDVIQIACSVDTAKQLSDFLSDFINAHSATVDQHVVQSKESRTGETSPPVEERRVLSEKRSTPH